MEGMTMKKWDNPTLDLFVVSCVVWGAIIVFCSPVLIVIGVLHVLHLGL
jgi:hypothetical protein